MNHALRLRPPSPSLSFLRPQHTPAAPCWQELPLAAGQASQVLPVARGTRLLLEGAHGRVWLTCEGRPEDHFLAAGAALAVTGPARVCVSAEGRTGAGLRWLRVRV